jgi:hypothetical protein
VIDQQLVEWINSALDDRTTTHEVLAGLMDGRYKLFRYARGIVIAQITSHRRVLVFLMAGDKFDEWKRQANQDLESFADDLGIDVIEAYARPGLEKSLKDLGWKKEQVVLRRRKKNNGRSVWN